MTAAQHGQVIARSLDPFGAMICVMGSSRRTRFRWSSRTTVNTLAYQRTQSDTRDRPMHITLSGTYHREQ